MSKPVIPILATLAVVAAAAGLAAAGPTYPPRVAAPPLPAAPPFPVADLAAALKVAVAAPGRVDYRRLAADRAPLDRYVAALAAAGPRSTPGLFPGRAHALAWYLNAYNALVLYGVLHHYPGIESVTDIAALHGFFRRQTFLLDGQEVTLHDLENEIIRPRFQDPRIHFAINCASASCPPLAAEPFRPDRVDAQLDRQTRAFVSSPAGLRLERSRKRLRLSRIFDWYGDDFISWLRRQGTAGPRLPDYLLRYLPAGLRREVESACGPRAGGCEVVFSDYDWSLNDVRGY